MNYLLCLFLACSVSATAQINKQRIHENKYRKALEKHVKNADSTKADFFYQRGNIRLDYLDLEAAVIDYSKALVMDPENPKIYYNRGIAKMDLHLATDAVLDFTKVIELDPKKAYAYNNRSACKYVLKDYQGAIQDSSTAIELDPTNAEGYNNRGVSN